MRFKLIIDGTAEETVSVVAHRRSSLTDELESVVRSYSGENEISAYAYGEMRTLDFSNIECISVSGGKCEVIDSEFKVYTVRERLYEIEQRLPQCFIRINKSAIANERAIERFNTDFSGGVTVQFKCGHSDYVSRRCFAEIKRRFKKK